MQVQRVHAWMGQGLFVRSTYWKPQEDRARTWLKDAERRAEWF